MDEQNWYETVIISNPEIPEEESLRVLKEIYSYITDEIYLDSIGIKRLAYPIKEHNEGRYFMFNFKATKEQVATIERHFRITDSIMKFITVRQDETEEEFASRQTKVKLIQKSEQTSYPKPDAWDVLFGFANY